MAASEGEDTETDGACMSRVTRAESEGSGHETTRLRGSSAWLELVEGEGIRPWDGGTMLGG